MNVLLLGNGFDLYHHLPTQYVNFLHTADFLIKNYDSSMKTVGDILGGERLQKVDKYIAECYEQHKEVYETVTASGEDINSLIALLKDNAWFLFLISSFDKNVGWIDFEKEISVVLASFKKFLDKNQNKFMLPANDVILEYVITQFNYFYSQDTTPTRYALTSGPIYQIKPEYLLEYPLYSDNFIINKEKVIAKLHEELTCLAEGLKLYLSIFVDNTLEAIYKADNFKKCGALNYIHSTISFNYTNTYEKLYDGKPVFHLHGNIKDKIILGTNPDESDYLGTVDTSFVFFKKYFQRTVLETDAKYLQWLEDREISPLKISLIIMGHSLDITDEDVIKELFERSNEIYILYHSTEAKVSYISNLIKIFGKEKFDYIRKNQHLSFLSLDSDFRSLLY